MKNKFIGPSSQESYLYSQETNKSESSQETHSKNATYIPSPDGPTTSKRARGCINFITPRVASALDKCKISNRNVVYLISALAEPFNIETSLLILNTTSIRLKREAMRLERSLKITQ